jgi:hypothetical protein
VAELFPHLALATCVALVTGHADSSATVSVDDLGYVDGLVCPRDRAR